MRQRRIQLVITFSSTHEAMAFEKKAGELGISGRLIPLPTEISAGCGLAWKTEQDQKPYIIEQMKVHGLKHEEMYLLNLL